MDSIGSFSKCFRLIKKTKRWREIDKVIDASSRRLITQRKMLEEMEEDACFFTLKKCAALLFRTRRWLTSFHRDGEGWLESFLSGWIFVERQA